MSPTLLVKIGPFVSYPHMLPKNKVLSLINRHRSARAILPPLLQIVPELLWILLGDPSFYYGLFFSAVLTLEGFIETNLQTLSHLFSNGSALNDKFSRGAKDTMKNITHTYMTFSETANDVHEIVKYALG